MAARRHGYAVGMSDQRIEQQGGGADGTGGTGQVDGPAWGAADNAAANASPDHADEILGEHAEDGVTDADRGLTPDEHHHRAAGDLHQPRTGAETPWDPEDLVRARGQDVTPATLRQAQDDLSSEG